MISQRVLNIVRPLCPQTERLFAEVDIHDTDRLRIIMTEDQRWFILRTESALGKGRFASYRARGGGWWKRFPETKKIHTEFGYEMSVSATDTSALIIAAVWREDQIIFDCIETETAYKYLILTYMQGALNAEVFAKHRDGSLDIKGEYKDTKLPLADYQKAASHASMRTEGYALFMEQGTGKTPTTIHRICNEALNSDKQTYRALIVCPKTVLLNWRNEFERFSPIDHDAVIIRGVALKRMKQLLKAAKSRKPLSIVIVNYEGLTSAWDGIKEFDWDFCVLDESHMIKDARTKRWKQCLKLRDLCDKRIILTGTPIVNRIADLYCQLEFIGNGFSGFNSFDNFRKFYGRYERNGDGFELFRGDLNVPLIQERLSRTSFMIKSEEAMPDLPDKVYDVVEISLSKEQKEAYEMLAKHLAIEIERDMEVKGSNEVMIVQNVLVKLLRLAQITSGFLNFPAVHDDLTGDVIQDKYTKHFFDNPKLDKLISMVTDNIKEQPKDKIVVWACWRPDMYSIHNAFDDEGINHVMYFGDTSDNDRETAVYRFNNDPSCKVFVANPGAGGVGLNLVGWNPDKPEMDTNATWCIYYSQGWKPVDRWQSEKRLHRKNARRNVRITDLCATGTIDEEIRARVLAKKENAMSVQDVSQILDNVLNMIGEE